MALLSSEEIKKLVEDAEPPCLSIFMPTHRRPTESRQDVILLKNLLKKAEELLDEAAVDKQQIRELLAPVSGLLEDAAFWKYQRDGLSLFSSRVAFHEYRLPLTISPLVIVGKRFHLKPLFPLLTGDGSFYILALSQQQVRLFHATGSTASEVEVEDLPRDLSQAIGYAERARAHFYSTAPGAGRGRFSSVFFGWGFGIEEKKDDMLLFFQQVDNGVNRILAGQRAPLVLACVDYLMPIYHEANHYPYLLDEGVQGSPEEKTAGELRDLAWAIVAPRFLEAQRQAAEKFRNAPAGLASSQIEEVVRAAYYGRVDSLFVSVDARIWGDFDTDSGAVTILPGEKQGHDDLVDLATVHAMLHGGAVYAVEKERMPVDALVAACFRY